MKTLTFTNETHWRTVDFQRLVRAARAAVGFLGPMKVKIKFCKGGPRPMVALFQDDSKLYSILTFRMPRRGARDPHPVAMVALAASYAVKSEVGEKTTLLAFSDVYFMANYCAYQLTKFRATHEDLSVAEGARLMVFRSNAGDINCPDWMAPEKLYVTKYADPKKDASYKDFLKKKELVITNAEEIIANLRHRLDDLNTKLVKVEKRKRAAEKAIKAAKARRS